MAHRQRSGQSMRLFHFIQLLGNVLAQFHIIEIAEEKVTFEDLPKGFQGAIEAMLEPRTNRGLGGDLHPWIPAFEGRPKFVIQCFGPYL